MLEEAFEGAYAQPWDYDDEKDREDDNLSIVSAYAKRAKDMAQVRDDQAEGDEPPADKEKVAEDDKFAWTRVAPALPDRFAAIWEKNPLGTYKVRQRVMSKIPQIQNISKTPEFPTHVGLKPHYMDSQLASWDSRTREILRTLTVLHGRLSKEWPMSAEDPLSAEDVLETAFGMATALSRSLDQGRKALVDRRFKSIDIADDEPQPLFSAEDLKHLERFDKLKRTLSSRGNGGKGKGGKGKGTSYRYQPYGKRDDNRGRGKGGWNNNYNNNNKGKGSKDSNKFSFLQVYDNAKKG